MSRDPLLAEREATHGSFKVQGSFAQKLKQLIHEGMSDFHKLEPDQIESLEMICTKISRIVHGNPMEPDHWDDIAGYAKLGAEAARRAVK